MKISAKQGVIFIVVVAAIVASVVSFPKFQALVETNSNKPQTPASTNNVNATPPVGELENLKTFNSKSFGFEITCPDGFFSNADEPSCDNIYSRIEELISFPYDSETPWHNQDYIKEEQRAIRDGNRPSLYDVKPTDYFKIVGLNNVDGYYIYSCNNRDGNSLYSYFTFFTPKARVRLEINDLGHGWQGLTPDEFSPICQNYMNDILSGKGEENDQNQYGVRSKMIETIKVF